MKLRMFCWVTLPAAILLAGCGQQNQTTSESPGNTNSMSPAMTNESSSGMLNSGTTNMVTRETPPAAPTTTQ